MSINYPRPHHGSASEFQVSGFPFVTGSATNEANTSSAIRIPFPYVTQFIQITNMDDADAIAVAFTANGLEGAETANRFVIPAATCGPVLPIKCKEIFVGAVANTATFTVVAGLTNVRDFPIMTGSNGFEGVG